ncbi:PKD domain-containing protein [Quadrisphaera setariae]|nr:PKD domain-containing protein [Quadrisphaera setariae]
MKRSLALSVASAVVASSLVPFGGAAFAAAGDPAAAGPVLPPTVSADALPTVQINGVVWAQLVVGNTVYVTGDFTSARPAGAAAGTNETARRNILAYDIRTGNLITSWAPTLNSTGLALAASADGRTIYVGGNFTSSSGVASSRIVALDATTGAVVRSFSAAGANDKVRALAVVGDTVYAGGTFTAAGPAGQQTARSRLAAFKASDGSLTDWAPQADAEVLAMVAPSSTPEIVIGGRFAAVNGAQALGTAAVDLTSGASLPWEINKTVYEYGAKSAIWSLSTDGTSVYGTGYDTDRIGNLENAFAADANGGGIRWVNGCLGDSYSSFPMNGVLYTVGHTHECESLPDGIVDKAPRAYQNAIAMTTANFGNVNKTNAYGWSGGLPGPSLLHWLPTLTSGTYTTSKQAAWSLAGNSQYLVMGGEFPTVNGTAQQGLTRFAVRSQAPMKQGPQQASTMAVDVANTGPGQVSASFLAAWDRDDESLTYELLRGPAASPTVVATATAKSAFWDRKRLTLVDPSPVVGTLTSYRVRTTDGSGNVQVSPPQAITATATMPSTAYDDAVRADAPDHYWSLGEASGAAGFDTSGSAVTQSLSVDPSATRGAEGQVAGTTATTFTGTVEVPIPGAGIGAKTEVIAHATTTQPVVAPQTYSTEAWFKTTSTSGGEIISFGNRREDFRSSAYDRSTYLTDDGSVIGGVYDGRVRTIQSKPGYNDGQWHHVVQTKGAGGLAMYVDGVLVGRDAGVSGIQDYEGYWRLGGDNLGGWPGQVSSSALAGSVEDVAVYGTALTSAQVANHYRASGRTPAGAVRPADSYGQAVYDLGPDSFWRLQDAAGATSAADSGPAGVGATYLGGATPGAAGVPGIAGSTGVQLDGQDDAIVSTQRVESPRTYSMELWFNTTTTRGGRLIGFGDRNDGLSNNYDRHVWMQDDGKLVFGVWTGQENRATSSKAYNDGKWHHLVASQGAAGMVLTVDGSVVGTNSQQGSQEYAGYWRVGGDRAWGGNSSQYFAGTVDDVAIYPSQLTTAQVADHAKRGGVDTAPTAAFTSAVNGTTVSVDAGTSADLEGPIASYAWTFGDGATAAGATASHTYAASGSYAVTLTVTDSAGQTSTSTNQVVIRPAAPADAYGAAVYADAPDVYYRMDGAAGSTSVANSSQPGNPGLLRGGAVTGVPGALGGGLRLNGSDGYLVEDQGQQRPSTYSAELWFNTTTTRGGKLIGTGNAKDGTSWSNDRNVTMQDDGRLSVNVWTGQENRYTTDASYNDGTWHHVVLTQGAAGLRLYVDGAVVLSNAQTGNESGYGYWRVGGDTTWRGTSSSFYLDGTVDEVAIYDRALSAETVANHYKVSGLVKNAAPTASFTSQVSDLGVALDASASADSDGTVASYAWDFGDGATGTGATTSHTYTAAGTYTVKLVVTDDKGATGEVTRSVTVAPRPNAAPTASFTSQVSDLGVALDGSGSADSDGTVASYAWDFGDQSTGTGRTTSHTYTAAGTYTVKLVVTDDKGATGTVSRSVTVTAPVVAPTGLLTDTFTRTATSGWGTADAGGAWTPTSGAANFSVDGSTGLLVIPGASNTRSIYASSLSSTNVDLVSTLALDKLPTGTGTTVSLLGRRISATTDYRVQARISSTGQVVLGLGQVVNGTYTSLGQQTVSGLKYTAGAPLRMRLQVVGTGTTALRAKVWAAGTAEPTAWNLSATDSAAALQAPGSVGVMGFLSASSTNAPVTLRVDDLSVTTAQ